MTVTATAAPHVNGSKPTISDNDSVLLSAFKTPEQVLQANRRTISELMQHLDTIAAKQPKEYLYDCINRGELGSAELLCAIAKGYVVYDRASSEWYIFNGLHWELDSGGNVYSLAGKVLSSLYRQLAAEKYQESLDYRSSLVDPSKPTESDKAHISGLNKEAKRAEEKTKDLYKLAYIKNVLFYAGATEFLGVVGEEWDAQTNLLGVNNGVIDLATGKLVMPHPAQYIRTIAPTDFVSGAICPVFDESIREIFANDDAIVSYVQRLLGYAMSGTCHESDFFVWYGKNGRNGKEFILERIQMVLGAKLSGVAEAELLLSSKNQRAKNSSTEALMTLRGRRLAWASETNEGRSLDNAMMKDLSGGRRLTGRHNHGKQEEWWRTHTLILLTNHKPHVSGGGGGAEWERIKLLSFTESFVSDPNPADPHQHKKDPTLGNYIDKNELPGVLNWLIRGCLEWRKSGMQTPDSVKNATKQYREDEDTLGRFIADRCIEDAKEKVGRQVLFDEYVDWCEKNKDKGMGSKTFYDKIEDRGFQRPKRSGAGSVFKGLRVKTAAERFADLEDE